MQVAKVVQGTIDPGRIDEAARAVEQQLIPRFAAHVGARQGYWMADRRNGSVMIVTTWTDADAMQAARDADGIERASVADQIGLRIHVTQAMEVVASHHGDEVHTPAARWARATWVEGEASGRADALAAHHRELVPELERSDGFHGSFWLADHWTGNGLALSFWDGPQDLAASEHGSRRRRQRVVRQFGLQVDRVTEYEGLGVVLAAGSYGASAPATTSASAIGPASSAHRSRASS